MLVIHKEVLFVLPFLSLLVLRWIDSQMVDISLGRMVIFGLQMLSACGCLLVVVYGLVNLLLHIQVV